MKAWPGLNDWLYAAKTFAAAMLSLYLAMSIGLARPYWAMATVYIVAQPLAGATRSKAAYRLVGTLVGAIVTVALVPNLVNAPELLSAALALWTGACLYVALLDRTPRSYLFMLAGYTTALIGFPAVTTPDAIWSLALERVEEIGIGILCTTVISAVVFPRPLGPLLSGRILTWVDNASTWTEKILSGSPDTATPAPYVGLAADAVELRLLASHLSYDTSHFQTATRWVAEMQRRMVLLLPLLAGIADRLGALRAANAITPALDQLLAELRQWVRAGAPPARQEADRMRTAISRLEAETDPHAGWDQVVSLSLLRRLRQLVDLRQDIRDLRRHIDAGGGPLATPLAVNTHRPLRQHRDHGMALWSALASVLTIAVLCTFWIASTWAAGASAVGFAAVVGCLFAAPDDPTPAMRKFLIGTALSVVGVGIGQFAILPVVHDFGTLTLVLGAFFIPVGLLTAIPATQPFGAALGFIASTLLGLQSTYAANFVTFADGGMAVTLGVATSLVMTALVRSVGAGWSARRLLRTSWRDLAAIPDGQAAHDSNALSELLLDRLGLLVPRLAASGAEHSHAAVTLLTDLRVGINMVDLQRDRAALPPSARAAVSTVLLGAARYFAAQAEAGRTHVPPPDLLCDIDRALDAAIALGRPRNRDLLLQLVGIRRSLFADAPPHHPEPAATSPRQAA